MSNHVVKTTIKSLLELDKAKIIRPEYGQTSLQSWEPTYDDLIAKLKFIEKYANNVGKKINDQVQGKVSQINSSLTQIINFDETQFVTNRQRQAQQIDTYIQEVIEFYPHYAIAALSESGLLDNVDIKSEFKELTSNLKEQTKEALEKIDSESQEIIKQAKLKAEEIENSVRKTAEKVSVSEAQQQFQEGADHNVKQIIIWSILSGILIATFVIMIAVLLSKELPNEWTWQLLYKSIIRGALLTIIGTLLRFTMKILRGHLHMHQLNLHRKRIANSMSAFAESASTKEQRDKILTQLVESVSNFGNSGIINKENDSNSNFTIETITNGVDALKNGK
jgi:hypothetical protein